MPRGRTRWPRRSLAAAAAWLGDGVLGGDLNLRRPHVPGWTALGGNYVDHVLGRGVTARRATVLERASLSDHAPVLVEGIGPQVCHT